MTLAEILARYPAGSDERLAALAAWRKGEDERAGPESRTCEDTIGQATGAAPSSARRDNTACPQR
jgi:hypothetical protein